MGAATSCCQRLETSPKAARQRGKQVQIGRTWRDKPEPIEQPRLAVFSQDELEDSFNSVDLDGSGNISEQELASLLAHVGVKFTAKSLFALHKMMDGDGNGSITKQEFIQFFDNRDKKLGLKQILAQVMAEKLAEKEAQRARQTKKTVKDVYIMHGLSENDGLRRSLWLLDVLEFADLTVTGHYVDTKAFQQAMESKHPGQLPEAAADPKDCAVVALLLDKTSLLTDSLLHRICEIEKQKVPIITFFEADTDAWEKLHVWRHHAKYAFRNTAVPISKHFPSDSEQLVLEAVFKLMNDEAPILRELRPPGGDLEDFSCLNMPGTKWLRAEYAMAVRPGTSPDELPNEAFCEPGLRRTCFISYAQEDRDQPGLSILQHKHLKEAIKRNLLGGRIFFLDHMSLDGRSTLTDYELTDVFSLSRFVILSDVGEAAKDKRPYLSRGKCFLEALISLLTGSLAPHRDGQFVDLDNQVGAELECGMNLRKYFRVNAANPYKLVNRLCNMLSTKEFESQAEQLIAEKILRRALERHPLLVTTSGKTS